MTLSSVMAMPWSSQNPRFWLLRLNYFVSWGYGPSLLHAIFLQQCSSKFVAQLMTHLFYANYNARNILRHAFAKKSKFVAQLMTHLFCANYYARNILRHTFAKKSKLVAQIMTHLFCANYYACNIFIWRLANTLQYLPRMWDPLWGGGLKPHCLRNG